MDVLGAKEVASVKIDGRGRPGEDGTHRTLKAPWDKVEYDEIDNV